MALNSFLSNQGTQTSLLTDNTGGLTGTLVPVMKIDISTIGTAGTIWNGNPTGGTVNTIGTLGTMQLGTVVGFASSGATLPATAYPIVTGGTSITNGTVFGIQVDSQGHQKFDLLTGTLTALSNGTVRTDARTTQNIVSFGTQVSGTAAVVATIVGSASVGAGTSLWVNNLSINNPNANVGVIIGFGTAQQGTNVLHRGTFGTTGAVGVVVPFPKATNNGMTNQDLVVSLTAAGTVDVNVSYFISA